MSSHYNLNEVAGGKKNSRHMFLLQITLDAFLNWPDHMTSYNGDNIIWSGCLFKWLVGWRNKVVVVASKQQQQILQNP